MTTTNRPAKFVPVLCFTLVLLALQSCTTVNHSVGKALNLETDLTIELSALADINPDEMQSASPVFVYLYELSSPNTFEAADFIDLYERDQEVLGDSFVSKQELKRILPNSTREERFVLAPETRYVGLFAQFYRYKDANAKLVFPVTSSNVVRNHTKIKISKNTITLGN